MDCNSCSYFEAKLSYDSRVCKACLGNDCTVDFNGVNNGDGCHALAAYLPLYLSQDSGKFVRFSLPCQSVVWMMSRRAKALQTVGLLSFYNNAVDWKSSRLHNAVVKRLNRLRGFLRRFVGRNFYAVEIRVLFDALHLFPFCHVKAHHVIAEVAELIYVGAPFLVSEDSCRRVSYLTEGLFSCGFLRLHY